MSQIAKTEDAPINTIPTKFCTKDGKEYVHAFRFYFEGCESIPALAWDGDYSRLMDLGHIGEAGRMAKANDDYRIVPSCLVDVECVVESTSLEDVLWSMQKIPFPETFHFRKSPADKWQAGSLLGIDVSDPDRPLYKTESGWYPLCGDSYWKVSLKEMKQSGVLAA